MENYLSNQVNSSEWIRSKMCSKTNHQKSQILLEFKNLSTNNVELCNLNDTQLVDLFLTLSRKINIQKLKNYVSYNTLFWTDLYIYNEAYHYFHDFKKGSKPNFA